MDIKKENKSASSIGEVWNSLNIVLIFGGEIDHIIFLYFARNVSK